MKNIKIIAPAVFIIFAFILFFLGYYYAWVSTSYGGVGVYDLISLLFGVLGYIFFFAAFALAAKFYYDLKRRR